MNMAMISHKLRAAFIFCLVLVLFSGSALYALEYSYDENAGVEYNRALQLYNQEKFDQAAEAFSALVTDYPYDARITIFKLLHAKSLFYAKRYPQSKAAFERLIKSNPHSSYVPSSHYFLGKIYYAGEQYDSAAQEFMQAVRRSNNRGHKAIFEKNFLALARSHMNADQVNSYAGRTDDRQFAFEIGLAAAEKYYAERNFDRAQDILDNISGNSPGSSDDKRIAALRKKIEQFASQKAVIALFAPLSGDWAKFGRMMSNALDMALEEYRKNPGIEVEKKTFDTFGDMIASAINAKKLSSQPPSAVIGPLSSAEAVGVAAFADISDIPVIAPTASEKGLTSLSDMFFQLSPTPERMGEALAEFVTGEIGIDSVAILAPLDNYGKQITDGFVHTALDSGVTIFYQKFYPRGNRDYRRFILDLKKELLPDTFVADIFLNAYGDTMEVEEVPLHVPAIFLPSYTSELKMILPQLRFYKISTILLGSDSYGESEIVDMSESGDNPILFVSKSLTLPEDTGWLKFNYLYQQEFEEPPEEVAAATYDAANIVLDCVRQGAYTPDEIWECVTNKKEYIGASGKIRFDANHENIFVPVYFLSEGQVVRLE
jgi:branched-chain amino acid transport system substrate-binding protein